MPELITLDEVCRQLGYTRRAIYYIIKKDPESIGYRGPNQFRQDIVLKVAKTIHGFSTGYVAFSAKRSTKHILDIARERNIGKVFQRRRYFSYADIEYFVANPDG